MLRAPELSDVDSLYRWENHPDRLLHGRVGLPYSREFLTRYVEGYNTEALTDGHVRFIIEHQGQAVGIADLYDIDLSARKAFVSIFIDETMRRNRLGAGALDELSQFSFNHLGLNQIVAVVAKENIASVALFEKSGYRQIATLPQWVRTTHGTLGDALLMSLHA